MKNFYLLALVWLMALSAYGQKMKTAVADKYYEDYQFLAAAQAYERIIKSDAKNVAVMEKLVHCYTRLNDPVKSEFWLAKVLKTPLAPAKSFKTFGTLLAANGKYEEASLWFSKSYEQTRDEESLRWLNTYRNLQQFYADSALYQISKVTFNSKYSDFSPTFYQEGVVFSSARDNGKVNKMKFDYNNTWFIDLYFVKDTLAKPIPFSDVLNSKYHEGPLSFAPDQKTVFFTRNNHLKKSFFSSDGVSKLKIYYASVYNGRWGQIREFNLNNKEYSVGQPALASDNLMFFVSDMPGGFGGTDLYRTEKVNEVWQKPVNLGPEINTSGNEMFPYVGEGNMLYFASNGHPGLGGLDVFYTAVSGTDFSAVTNVGYPVNTARDDFGFIIRNNHGYFSSNRDGKTTNDDIYRFKVNQNHPVMVIARENAVPSGADSLSGEQGKEAALALASEKETEQLAATQPGGQGAGEEVEENKLQAATNPALSANPGLEKLAEAGALHKDPQMAAAGKPAEEQVPGTQQNGQADLLLAASPAGDAAEHTLPGSPGNAGAGAGDKPLTGEQDSSAGPDSARVSGQLRTAQAEKDQGDPEEGNRNTFDLQAAAGAPETTAAADGPPARSQEKEAGALAINSLAARDTTFPDDAEKDIQAAVLAGNSSSEIAAGFPEGAAQKNQADTLPGSDAKENIIAATQVTQADILSGVSTSKKDAFSGESTAKITDSHQRLAIPGKEQIGTGNQGQEDIVREAGLGQALAGTGSQTAGKEEAINGSDGKIGVEVEAGEGSMLTSANQDQEEGLAIQGTGAGNEVEEAGGLPGKINRVKSLPKEFKTGSVGEVIELEIRYDLDKTTIRPDAAYVLDGLVAYMKRNPNVKVELGAHTDVRGSDAYNERLSQGRAESVVDYLARHGIASNRLVPVGFGEKDLAVATASNEAEHQVNRRTTAKIFANEAMLMAYHETVTQPKLAAIRAQQEQEKASRLAADFPLFPSPDASLTGVEASASGQQTGAGINESTAGIADPIAADNQASNKASVEADPALPAANTEDQQARSTRLMAAAEDGVSFEEAAPAPAPVYAREMLFWNPHATDPKTAAAQAKKNPDTFFIISNAFLSLVEAEWYMQEVLDLGGDGRIIMPFAGSKLYRVAVAGYNRYTEAERQLPGKKQIFGTHSWILGLNSREFALRRMMPEQPVPQAVAAALGRVAPASTTGIVPAATGRGNHPQSSAHALVANLARRIEGLETRLAAAEAGVMRTVKAYTRAPKVLYDKMVEANRHRASARLWAEVAPYTIDQKTGRAYIISGSFSTLGSANWYRKKMARMGGESNIILPTGTNRLYLVTVADYAGRPEARQKLMALKRTFGLYIWVLDY